MAIEIPNPIVIPAQPSKTADKVYILTMNVNSNSGIAAPTTAYFSVAPFVSSTGEILRDQMQHISIPDVFTACEQNVVLAQAVNSIYAAVDSLCKERGLFGMQPDPVMPTISSQPSNASLTSGDTANFSIVASGNQLTYQWQKDNVNLVDDSRITGATTAQLSISNVSDLDNGNYTAIVTNSAGTVTSDIATLTVG